MPSPPAPRSFSCCTPTDSTPSERIPDLLAPFDRAEADVVQGSRMLGGGALRGGMPFYKYIANKALTALENRVFGLKMAEYHSGHMVYARRFLEAVPFERFKEVVEKLRVFFKFDRRLLGDLCRCALRSLTCYFEAVTGSALTPGVIAAIQTFGDRINLHVHLHFLVTEGGVDEAGVFHKIPRIDDSRLAEIFVREVLAMLVRKELWSIVSSVTSSSPLLRRGPRRLRSPRRSS